MTMSDTLINRKESLNYSGFNNMPEVTFMFNFPILFTSTVMECQEERADYIKMLK